MTVSYAAVPCSMRKARRSCASSPRRQACSPCSSRRTCSRRTKPSTLHITDKAQLDGLPETAIAAAEQNAKEQEKEGWIFTLDFPVFSPFMTYSTQRELRKQMYMARNTECTHDNDAEQPRDMQATHQPETRAGTAAGLRHLCRLRAQAPHGKQYRQCVQTARTT